MKRSGLLVVLLGSICLVGACSSSSSSGDTASDYATFGATLNEAVPDGLKAGVASASLAAMQKELSGTCAADYTDCPYLTAFGGGDSDTGEIFLRLWSLDYNSECTAALLASGICFDCTDCQTGGYGSNFIMPTMLEDPTACATTSTTQGRYVNFGIDPCFFDTMIADISNIAECETVTGGAVDISSAVPWYASWGIPQTVNFSSYYSKSNGGGIWWTVINGASANQQYFLSLDSDWLYMGNKDPDADEFLFLGTGSPAYYAGRGEGSGVNIAAYAGTLSAIPAQFQAIQVRVQDQPYIERMISNGSYLWYQKWSGGNFPSAPADVDTVKNSPSGNRCVQIGTAVVTSKYVPLANCVLSFEKASVDDLNLDSNFILKVIDGQTASSIDFSTALTPTTTTSCLEEEAAE